MSSHTKGRWTVGDGLEIRTEEDGIPLAQASSAYVDKPEAQANAYLMATAPILLAALRETLAIVMIQNGNLHADTNEIIARAQAAIGEAT